METARTLQDYNGPVCVNVYTEADEVRYALFQNGACVSFTDEVLDALNRERDAFKDKLCRERRLAVARAV